MLPVMEPGFSYEEWNKSCFFLAQKLSDLGPVLYKQMQLKRVTDEQSH